jgi:hypothetical protein
MSVTLNRTSVNFSSPTDSKQSISKGVKKKPAGPVKRVTQQSVKLVHVEQSQSTTVEQSRRPRVVIKHVIVRPMKVQRPQPAVQKIDEAYDAEETNKAADTEDDDSAIVRGADLASISVCLLTHTVATGLLLTNLCDSLSVRDQTVSQIRFHTIFHFAWSFVTIVSALKPNQDMINHVASSPASSHKIHVMGEMIKHIWDYQVSVANNVRRVGHLVICLKFFPESGIRIPSLAMHTCLISSAVLHGVKFAERMDRGISSIKKRIFGS